MVEAKDGIAWLAEDLSQASTCGPQLNRLASNAGIQFGKPFTHYAGASDVSVSGWRNSWLDWGSTL